MGAVEDIKARLNIVDVISTYVPLKKAGRSYKGLCPFHSEKTPSFVVFPEQGTWHCFGACGTGGDIFTFLQKRENLPFTEVLSMLAKQAGVTLDPRPGHTSEDESRENRLRQAIAAATAYFHHILISTPQGTLAHRYLNERGFTQETIERFELGYALDQWDAGLKHWRSQGFELDDLVTAGLVTEREGGHQLYDRFRHRLIIPIRDIQGRPIGFGARTLGEALPKYLNSPATPLFDKSKVLFALDASRNGIRERGEAVIVEGYMDALAAHQAGFDNVVAAMGTALTEMQLGQLKRLAHRFVLALDPDAAGEKATVRGLQLARSALDRHEAPPAPTPRGLVRMGSRLDAEIHILSLPPGKDPDEVIRANPADWEVRVAAAQPLIDYFMDLVIRNTDLGSPQGKVEAVQTLAPMIAEVGNLEAREHYIQRLARLVRANERLIEERVVEAAKASTRANAASATPTPPQAPAIPAKSPTRREQEQIAALAGPDSKRTGLEIRCITYLLTQPELLPGIQAELTQEHVRLLEEEDFLQAENRALFALLDRYVTQGDQQALTTMQQDPGLSAVAAAYRAALVTIASLPEERTIKSLVDTVLHMRVTSLRMRMQELQALLEDSAAEQDRTVIAEYARLMRSHAEAVDQIDKLLASRRLTGSSRRPM